MRAGRVTCDRTGEGGPAQGCRVKCAGLPALVQTGSLGPAVPLVQGSLTAWVLGLGSTTSSWSGSGGGGWLGHTEAVTEQPGSWGDKASQAGGSPGETGDPERSPEDLKARVVAGGGPGGAVLGEPAPPPPIPEGGRTAAEPGPWLGSPPRLNAGAAVGPMGTPEAPGRPAPPLPHVCAGH